MKNDFELIVHKFPRELSQVNIYPIGDLHIGSNEFNIESFRRWKNIVMNDDFAKVVIVGDIMDMATKTSVTNIYESRMNPFEQKEWVTKDFGEFRDKIIGAVQGNHEYRANNLLGICPMYDVLAKLDLEHLYRPNMAFMKINLGQRSKSRQVSYTIVLGHGASKTKTSNFSYSIDGMDILITGHIHQPNSGIQSKIVIDSQNEVVRMRDFYHITVPSFQKLGGYSLKGMYLPQSSEKFPVINLNGNNKEVIIKWM